MRFKRIRHLFSQTRLQTCREFFERPVQAFFHLAFVHKREFSITLKGGNSLAFSREKRDNKFWDWFFESPRPVEFTESGLVRIEWEGRPILFRPGTMDFFAFQELFIDDVYDLKSINRPLGTVIDLGANAGMFALAIAPKAKRLIAVEPVSANCEHARKNLRINHRNPDDVLQLAVSDVSDSEVKIFHNERNTGGHSIALDWARQNKRHDYEVAKTVTIADLLEMCGCDDVDLLKCDVEGSEYETFLGTSAADLRRIRSIVMEVHVSPTHPASLLRELIAHLESAGFDVSLDGDIPVTDRIKALLLTADRLDVAFSATAQNCIE